MSVINQMLRDLHFEQRKDHATHQRQFLRLPEKSAQRTVGLMIVFIVIAAWSGVWREPETKMSDKVVISQLLTTPQTQLSHKGINVSAVPPIEKQTAVTVPSPNSSIEATSPKKQIVPKKETSTISSKTHTQSLVEKTEQAFQPAQEKAALFDNEASAIVRWQTHITQTPDDYAAQLIWLSYWSQRDRQQATQWAERALQHNPDRIEVRQMLAQLYVQNQQAERAISLLRAQQPALVDAPDYYALFAHAHLQLQQFASAAPLFQSLTNRFPQQGRYWAGLASSLQGLRRTGEEQAAWRHALNDPQLNDTLRQYALQRLQIIPELTDTVP